MAFDLSKISSLSEAVAADPKFAKEFWSESIRLDSRQKNPLKDFIGAEKSDGSPSGLPITDKRDLNAGGSATVTFTTTVPVRGAGVMGESELKSNTGKFEFGTFGVTVDMRRFAMSDNQLLELLRMNKGMTPEELRYKLCKEWWERMETDDLQHVYRNKALSNTSFPNLYRIGGRATRGELTLADTLDTVTIQRSKNMLVSQGAQPIRLDTDMSGSDVPRFLLFAPLMFAEPLEDEQKFREALNYGQARGKDNFYFDGKYPIWKNNVIQRHNIEWDTADGRQGSPLQPIAFLGAPLANATPTTITGGGSWNVAGTKTNIALNDYFAYFLGYYHKTYTGEVAPTDSETHYAIIYNTTDQKYEGISWVAAGNNGNTLTVTREVASILPTAHARYSNVHPTGSWIIPCNVNGVPIGWALHTGSESQFLARGSVDAEEITWEDDFRNRAGRAHVNASGIQGIRGYAPYEDSLGRYPNYVLIEGAVSYEGLDLVPMPA